MVIVVHSKRCLLSTAHVSNFAMSTGHLGFLSILFYNLGLSLRMHVLHAPSQVLAIALDIWNCALNIQLLIP